MGWIPAKNALRQVTANVGDEALAASVICDALRCGALRYQAHVECVNLEFDGKTPGAGKPIPPKPHASRHDDPFIISDTIPQDCLHGATIAEVELSRNRIVWDILNPAAGIETICEATGIVFDSDDVSALCPPKVLQITSAQHSHKAATATLTEHKRRGPKKWAGIVKQVARENPTADSQTLRKKIISACKKSGLDTPSDRTLRRMVAEVSEYRLPAKAKD